MRASLLKTSFASACLVVAFTSQAQDTTLSRPDIHGDQVVFTAQSDLWIGTVSGATASRITTEGGLKTNAHFSPDGKWIAFTGQYEGGQDVYVMPANGGAPKRLTYDPLGAQVLGWTEDGKSIVYRSFKASIGPVYEKLFTVPAIGGSSQLLPLPEGEFGSFNSKGQLAYVPHSFEWANWFHYKGGGVDKIWLADLKSHKFTKLTDTGSVDTTPVWCGDKIYFVSERTGWLNLWEMDGDGKNPKQCTFYTNDHPVRYPSSDGKKVIFQHGPRLAVFDPETRKVSDLTFQMSSDHIHERDQRIPLAPEVGPATVYTYGGSIGRLGNGVSLGPTGKRILLEVRGQIVSVASEAGDMRVLEKKPGARARFPAWAPDGKSFAFISDRSGENELWIGDATGGQEPKQLTHGLEANPFPPAYSPDGKWISIWDRSARLRIVNVSSGEMKLVDQSTNDGSYDGTPGYATWSPDSKLIAFSRNSSNWLTQVRLYEVATGKQSEVSDVRMNAYGPTFDSTGKFLAFLIDGNFDIKGSNLNGKYFLDKTSKVVMVPLAKDAKSPFLPKDDEEGEAADVAQKEKAKEAKAPAAADAPLDLTDLTSKIFAVPVPAGRYAMLGSFPGHLLIQSQDEDPDTDAPPTSGFTVLSYDLDKRATTPIIEGVSSFQQSLDGKKILFQSERSLSVHDMSPAPTTMAQGAVNLAPYSITYSPRKEWDQIFEESWRIGRDFFYDPGMHGLDWNAIRTKYEARLKMVGDRSDLSSLLKDMVSELNSGHAYVQDPSSARRPQNMGFLGADFEPTPDKKALKIVKLYKGDAWTPELRSPLLDAGLGVKEGDYILEVAGQAVKGDQDIQALLLGTVGQTVAVLVNDKPSREGARVVRVRPLPTEIDLRYQNWVEGREKYVETHGGPDFGYAHMRDMESNGLTGFLKGQTGDPFKKAMVYDTRYNGGGFTSSLILQDIGAYPTSWFKPRYGNPWTRENWAVLGHKVALCNEGNFSDGELFIEDWKKMKLGPVVGTRTGGGEVGSGGGYELIDHGTIYIPNYGAYRDGAWMIEGKGATPTVDVEQDPNEVMAGRDPQLDRAIAILKAMLEKDPVSVPQHPPFPVKTVKPKDS